MSRKAKAVVAKGRVKDGLFIVRSLLHSAKQVNRHNIFGLPFGNETCHEFVYECQGILSSRSFQPALRRPEDFANPVALDVARDGCPLFHWSWHLGVDHQIRLASLLCIARDRARARLDLAAYHRRIRYHHGVIAPAEVKPGDSALDVSLGGLDCDVASVGRELGKGRGR